METSLFDFYLPEELIAQAPVSKRDHSRLMVINRKTQTITHTYFHTLGDHLPKDAALIRNTVSVLKARLKAYTPNKTPVECLLLHPGTQPNQWWCLLKPGKKLSNGRTFGIDHIFEGTVNQKNTTGKYLVDFKMLSSHQNVIELSDNIGEIPLPPYISRKADNCIDNQRYQTVYANPSQKEAAAAPTAGLHFTPELLDKLKNQGIGNYDLTLRIGLGTFQPIKTDTITEHTIHTESYTIPTETQHYLFNPNHHQRVAVGTTSTRAIEHFMRNNNQPLPVSYTAEANLFLYPPTSFLGTDALITNFHLPRSTLMCLVSSFLTPNSIQGIHWLKEIYAEAIAQKYRFFSYGDAMLIL